MDLSTLASMIGAWLWWILGVLYFTFPLYLVTWPATFAAFVSARSEYLISGGGVVGTWKAVTFLFLNLPRIIFETIRWLVRVLIIDLPRVFGKDVSSTLPQWMLRWIGHSSSGTVKTVEKIVYRDRPVHRSFKSGIFLRLRWMTIGAVVLLFYQQWDTVGPWITRWWQ